MAKQNQVYQNIKWIAVILSVGIFGALGIFLLSFALTIPYVVLIGLYLVLLVVVVGFLILLLSKGVWRKR